MPLEATTSVKTPRSRSRPRAVLAQPEEAEIRTGLQRLRWPGRFEVIEGDPLVVLDGAHNDASAEVLARTLVDFAAGRPIHLVLGINRDKDARAILRPLLPLASSVWATQVTDSRASDARRGVGGALSALGRAG